MSRLGRLRKTLIAACGVGALAAAGMIAAPASAATPVLKEDFANGLGAFTGTGSASASGGAAVLRGSLFSSGPTLTSGAINLAGYTGLSVSYQRTASGLDSGESFTVAYSVDGGAYVPLESAQTATGPASFPLPSSVDGRTLRLRFSLTANSLLETLTVDDVLVQAGQGGGGEDPGPQPGGSLPPVQDVTKPGPYAVTITKNTGPSSDGWLAYPTNLGQNGVDHPIFVWGPGAGTGPAQYEDMLRQWASHGFVVFSKTSNNDGRWMTQTLDWLQTQNGRTGSPLYQRLDLTEIAFGGHSRGSIGTFAVANDPRLTTTIHVAGGSFDGNGPRNLRKPTLYIGGDGDIATSNTERDYAGTTVPVWFSILRNTDHIYATRNGQHIITAWLRWHLGDEEFRRTQDFLRRDCTFCGLGQTQYKNW